MNNIQRLRDRLRVAVDAERIAQGKANRWHKIYMKRFERRYALQQKVYDCESAAERMSTRLLGEQDHEC